MGWLFLPKPTGSKGLVLNSSTRPCGVVRSTSKILVERPFLDQFLVLKMQSSVGVLQIWLSKTWKSSKNLVFWQKTKGVDPHSWTPGTPFLTVKLTKTPLMAPFWGSETGPKLGCIDYSELIKLPIGESMLRIVVILKPNLSHFETTGPLFGQVSDPENGAISGVLWIW